MNDIGQTIVLWKNSLFPNLSIGGLLARNPVAHKWKAPFRSMMLREAVFWRLHDLLTQSHALHEQGHELGARILLRSGIETLATLIYLNQLTQKVIDGAMNFHTFCQKTDVLLRGSRNNDRGPESINIMTVLKKCEKRYPGLMQVYADLSESAHPSFEGLCAGYSVVDHNAHEITFSNRWMELYGKEYHKLIDLCMNTFHHEYNDVWCDLFDKLVNWIQSNDEELEATKNDRIPSS